MKKFINSIWDFVVNIPQDKLLHVVVLGTITRLAILLFKVCGYELMSVAYGWMVGFFIGVGKEIYDEAKKTGSEASDWAYDFVTITFVSLYSLFLML